MSAHANARPSTIAPGELHVVSRSDVGRARKENQDAHGQWFDAAAGLQLVVVADGMGGHRGGARASEIAIDEIGRCFARSHGASAVELLREGFARANMRIFSESRANLELSGMGTTGVAMLFEAGSAAWVAHVGDSRAYRIRDGQIEQLTEDHNLMNELMTRAGMSEREAAAHPDSQALLRALGPSEDVDVEIRPVSIQPNDVFVLCSDGLYGPVAEYDILDIVRRYPTDQAADVLIDEANRRGGPDNVTVQIAVVEGTGDAELPVPGATSVEHGAGDRDAASPASAATDAGPRSGWPIALAAIGALLTALLLGALFVPLKWLGGAG